MCLLVLRDVTTVTENLSADVAGKPLAFMLCFDMSAKRCTPRKICTAVKAAERNAVLFGNVVRVFRSHVRHESRQTRILLPADFTRFVRLDVV